MYVSVANYPDDYQARLVRVFPLWTNIQLWALEPRDLALTKLERSRLTLPGTALRPKRPKISYTTRNPKGSRTGSG